MEGEQVQVQLVLILRERYKQLLAMEKKKLKKGRNRKLTKEDHRIIEEECAAFAFPPPQVQMERVEEECLPQGLLDEPLEMKEEEEKKEEPAKEQVEVPVVATVSETPVPEATLAVEL